MDDLQTLIQFWKKQLGSDDILNPPNPLGEIIKETIERLEELHGYRQWGNSVSEALNSGDGVYRP